MGLLFGKFLTSSAHRPLSVFNETAAQDLQTFVKIFDSKDHTRATGKGLYLSATIVQLCDETLHLSQLSDHV
jgi:hypothetical protein